MKNLLISLIILLFDINYEISHTARGTYHFQDKLVITCHILCSGVILNNDMLRGSIFWNDYAEPHFRNRGAKQMLSYLYLNNSVKKTALLLEYLLSAHP